ncbi:MAG TPA: hypothetical protein PKY12_03765, partial [Catalimonadaceae bacterium]|nr:hypothetical protein [Catalimonadaceae bacterium]
MQNCLQTRLVPKLFSLVFLFAAAGHLKAQSGGSETLVFEQKVDSLFQASQLQIQDEVSSQSAEVWVQRGNILSQISENDGLKEKYKNIDFQSELSKAWNTAQKLDRKNEWKKAIETGLVASTVDLYNQGLEAMENARKFKSVGDGEKAEELFRMAFENYRKTGSKQYLVDEIWRGAGVNWKWVRFYHGLSLRQ